MNVHLHALRMHTHEHVSMHVIVCTLACVCVWSVVWTRVSTCAMRLTAALRHAASWWGQVLGAELWGHAECTGIERGVL